MGVAELKLPIIRKSRRQDCCKSCLVMVASSRFPSICIHLSRSPKYSESQTLLTPKYLGPKFRATPVKFTLAPNSLFHCQEMHIL